MRPHHANIALGARIAEAGWTEEQTARAVNTIGAEAGLALKYRRGSISQWLSGTRPRPPAGALLAEALSRRLGRPLTEDELGWVAPSTGEESGTDASCLLTPSAPEGHDAYDLGLTSIVLSPSSVRRAGRSFVGSPHQRAPEPAGRLRQHDVRSAQQLLGMFSDADTVFGGGRSRNALAGYLAQTVSPWLCLPAAGSVHRAMLTTAAKLAYLCGFMHFDDGLNGTAQRYYLLSLRLADEAEDPQARAVALRGLSTQAQALGHHRQAAELIEAAVAAGWDSCPPHIRAFLAGQYAVTAAADEQRSEALGWLRRAETTLAIDGSHTEPPGAYHMSALHLQHAVAAAYLDGPHDAIGLLRMSLAQRPSAERRSRALVRAQLAGMYLDEGNLEEACAQWRLFLADYPQLHSRRAETAYAQMRARLRPFGRHPIVRSLLL